MIPPFNQTGVLPPYTGDPAKGARAPYRATTAELVRAFGSTPRRLEILKGFLRYRAALVKAGIVAGFQWVDGSFCEDLPGGREPADLDLVTFYERPAAWPPGDTGQKAFEQQHPELVIPAESKKAFDCDVYLAGLFLPAVNVVALAHYWYGLFGHRRVSLEWKGMVQVSLDTSKDMSAQLAIVLAQSPPAAPTP